MQDNETIVCKKYDKDHYIGEITEFIDKYVVEKHKHENMGFFFRTYLWGLEENLIYKK